METYEFEGKTTEEAIENASRELHLPVEELQIDIIEPGSAGIFGLVGSKKAKIKVTVKEEGSAPISDEVTAETETEPGPDTDMETGKEVSPDMGPDNEVGVALAKETLENILALIPVEVSVSAEQGDGNIALTIEGDKSGLLIGRKGKTLDALQFIVNRIVNKTLDKRMRVVVDSENYRQRRRESLTQMALRMGDKAKRIGKPVTTNPLNPRERRIIHLALKEDGRLKTKSKGEGLLKKVVIFPKR
ncbi:MAG: RNA-binding cell elongation regulator Jag/EloR [Desulfobacteraceae bacterium]|jgi:spoIIIJ-associated protein